jgi:hypothetical protein
LERPEGWIVARLKERHEARVPDLNEIRDRVRQEVGDSLRCNQAVQVADGLLPRAQGGTPLATVAAADPRATFDTTDPFARLGYAKGIGRDPSVLGVLFASEVGLVPKVLRGRVGAFICSVDQKIPADMDQFNAQKTQQRQNELQQRQSQVMNDWLASLRKKAKVEDWRFTPYGT